MVFPERIELSSDAWEASVITTRLWEHLVLYEGSDPSSTAGKAVDLATGRIERMVLHIGIEPMYSG